MANKLIQFDPDYVVIPGETLKETIECIGMSQTELAERTGRPVKTINEIIKGKTAITPETAIQFERVLNISASFWNSLERNYQESLAKQEERKVLESQVDWLKNLPISIMVKYGWIKKAEDSVSQLQEVLNFFGVATIEAWKEVWQKVLVQPQVSFRKSQAFASSPESVSVWLRRGQIESQNIECKPFDKNVFKQKLNEIRSLTKESPEVFVPKMIELCAEAGVAVVFVKELPKCPVNGATYWLGSGKPVIQLSLRHKSNDHLWFTFFHEAGHILLHGKKETFLEYKNVGDKKEQEADEFASELLIPSSKYKSFIKKRPSGNDVVAFAESIDIAPGVVVGRLQHDGIIKFQHLNGLKKYYTWSN